jgi:hypothetical protein
VKLLRGVASVGNEASEVAEDGDPKPEYWTLVGDPTLLALASSVVNDCTEDVAEMRVPATVP